MDIEKYINELYENRNIGANDTQKNLYKKEEYLKLLKNVIETLNDNKDLSIEELRQKLYEKSKLEDFLKDFFLDRKMAPGAVITYGTKNFQERLTIGNKQEVVMENGILVSKVEEMQENTIFDLASTTKLFTSISVLKLVESGELNLNDEVVKYVPEFKNLKGLTVFDLLIFHPLAVPKKIDSAKNKEEAKEILLQATKKDVGNGTGIYNDIGPMILKYIVESITGINYEEFVTKEIINKINLNSTYINIPSTEINKVANHNYDGRIYQDGNYIIRDKANKGISSDDKARIFGQPEGILSGHAGLFSASSDMTKLGRALIENKILNLNIRDMMAKNRRGYVYMKPDGTKGYTQTYGMLVYSKNPDIKLSEVPYALSGKSFSGAGWTGTQTTIDPVNNLNFTLLSNRSHNRMTFIDKTKRDQVNVYNNGIKTFTLPNGYEMIDASSYATLRGDIVKRCLELAFEYKMLEDITGYSKNNDKIDENHRTIK